MSLSVDGSYSHCFGVLPEQNAYKTSLLLWGRYQAVQWGELLVNIGCILISVILSLFICNITHRGLRSPSKNAAKLQFCCSLFPSCFA